MKTYVITKEKDDLNCILGFKGSATAPIFATRGTVWPILTSSYERARVIADKYNGEVTVVPDI